MLKHLPNLRKESGIPLNEKVTTSQPSSPSFSLEDGEIREQKQYKEVEDWDAPGGKRRVEVVSAEDVSKKFHTNMHTTDQSQNPSFKDIDNISSQKFQKF